MAREARRGIHRHGEVGSTTTRTLFFWIVIFALVVLLWQSLQSANSRRDISFNDFQELVAEGNVARVIITDRKVEVTVKGGGADGEFRLHLPFAPGEDFVAGLMEQGVVVWGGNTENSPLLTIFLTWGPVLLIVGLWIFFMRQFSAKARQKRAEATAEAPE